MGGDLIIDGVELCEHDAVNEARLARAVGRLLERLVELGHLLAESVSTQ